MGMNVPFDLGKFVNENGRDPETLKILGILCVNILRTSPELRAEIGKIVSENAAISAQVRAKISGEGDVK
jgi:hypothetical protein